MTEPTPEPTHIEVTVAMWDEIQAGWRRTVRSLVALVAVVLLVVVGLVGFLGWRSYESQRRQDKAQAALAKEQRRQACIATLTGSALGRAFDALAAPPVAPNLTPEMLAKTPRGIAVARGLSDAHKLENIDRYC